MRRLVLAFVACALFVGVAPVARAAHPPSGSDPCDMGGHRAAPSGGTIQAAGMTAFSGGSGHLAAYGDGQTPLRYAELDSPNGTTEVEGNDDALNIAQARVSSTDGVCVAARGERIAEVGPVPMIPLNVNALNSMATDAHTIVMTQEGSAFDATVIRADGSTGVIALFADGKPLVQVAVSTPDDIEPQTERRYSSQPVSGETRITATADAGRVRFTLPPLGVMGFVRVKIAIVGYPAAACAALPLPSRCGAGPTGYFNPAKSQMAMDALDAMPVLTQLP